ncbi:MAG: lysylphosphatidylglycerol synthase domain-containing protein, partial [Haloplanus sp.]
RRRERLVVGAGGLLGDAAGRLGGVVPGVDPPDRERVVERGRGFVAALERVGDSRRRLATVLLLGAGGHLAVAATLWLSLAALGVTVSPARVLIVVPVARLAGASPTPGGTASAEALLTGLLVAVGGAATPVAAAAALVYRAAAFWLPTVGGGVVTALLLLTAHDSRR